MKNYLKKALTILALSAASLFSTSSAQAQTVYLTQTFSFDLTDLNVTKPFVLNAYDGPGELVGVSYRVTGYIEGTIFASNTSTTATTTVSALQEKVSFSVTGLPGGAPLSLTAFPFSPVDFVLGVKDSGTDYYELSGNGTADSGVVAIGSEYFSLYDIRTAASGTIGIQFLATEQLVFDKAGGNSSGGSAAQAQGTVTVTYAVAVPEPSTWAVMVLGAGLLVVSAKYRRRTA